DYERSMGEKPVNPRHLVTGPRLSRCVRDQLELGQPHGGLTIARGAIIAARRQRPTRADFGRVGQRAALELAELEKPEQEGAQMPFELADGVLVAVLGWHVRPGAFLARMPRAVAQESDARRRVAKAQRVVQVEVLQLVRTDDRLA